MPATMPARKAGGVPGALLRPLLLLLMVLPTGCAPSEPGDTGPIPERTDEAGATGSAAFLLLQGRIGPDAVAIEPALRIDAPAATQDGGERPHRVSGFDERGVTLFTVRFVGAPTAARPEEEHFNLVVSLTEDQAARLARIEVRAADGRQAVRTASLTAEAFAAVLAAEDVVSARRLDGSVVRLRWDGQRFPLLMARDPETREVLTFGRGGEATLVTSRAAVEVTLSEGVRSGTRRVEIR